MTPHEEKKISKFLSLVLRHSPERIGIRLDKAGWTDTDELIVKCNQKGLDLTRQKLEAVVTNNDKQRFSFNEDGSRIRASQGHSVTVELGYTATPPPETLYHGTAMRHLPSIRKSGLEKRQRHHVHLSATPETARKVGARHGEAVVLTIQAGKMAAAGHLFFQSENGVWLTEAVPTAYIDFTPLP